MLLSNKNEISLFLLFLYINKSYLNHHVHDIFFFILQKILRLNMENRIEE